MNIEQPGCLELILRILTGGAMVMVLFVALFAALLY